MNHRKSLASLTARSAAIMSTLGTCLSVPTDFCPSGNAGVAL